MKYTTYCKIEAWFEGESHEYTCLIYAENFADAAKQLEDFFGDELWKITHIEMFDESMIVFDNKDIAAAVYKELSWEE